MRSDDEGSVVVSAVPRSIWTPTYVVYLVSRFFSILSMQMLLLVLGLALYDLTGNPFYLGLAGLMIFTPALLLVFLTGLAADRLPRQAVLAACLTIVAVCTGIYTILQFNGALSAPAILATLAVIGCAKAFFNPTLKALLANVVPLESLPRAIAFNTSMGKFGSITGPILGGMLYAVDPFWAYLFIASTVAVAAIGALLIRTTTQVRSAGQLKAADMMGGFRVILSDRVLFGTMTLDLFAVLLGGTTVLLPVFAQDILHVGPAETGVLRASIAVGTMAVALLLTWRPLNQHAGALMLTGIFGYGAAITVFGLSTSFVLSALALAVAGGFDMVSIYVRESLIQLRTPDTLRGRVSAINSVFNSGANELGDFRAGSSAALIGAVSAVVIGGICAMGIAVAWARLYPDIRKLQLRQIELQ